LLTFFVKKKSEARLAKPSYKTRQVATPKKLLQQSKPARPGQAMKQYILLYLQRQQLRSTYLKKQFNNPIPLSQCHNPSCLFLL
jgi:hypothetical protein